MQKRTDFTCTVKKSKCDLGGSRGRMISASDRKNAVLLINEAITSGASCKKACERLGITERTFYRWKKRKADTDSYEDGRPSADHSDPANKIPAETRREIVNICNKPEYASLAPCEIVPALADEGIYIASESTFYRVLREEKMLNHRGRAKHQNTTVHLHTAQQVRIRCICGISHI